MQLPEVQQKLSAWLADVHPHVLKLPIPRAGDSHAPRIPMGHQGEITPACITMHKETSPSAAKVLIHSNIKVQKDGSEVTSIACKIMINDLMYADNNHKWCMHMSRVFITVTCR